MKITGNKLDYLVSSAAKRVRGVGSSCPSCRSSDSSLVAHKYWITQLRRCSQCRLLFRTPTTSNAENADFYQQRYTQGFTTDLPDPATLLRLKQDAFAGTEKDYSRFIDVFDALGVPRGSRIFDFGCSWGYGSWQFRQRGYDVESYEISSSRGEYAAARLGCKIHSDFSSIKPGFDVFFSSHVLEHVPSVREVIRLGMSILRPGGMFIAFSPNGAAAHRLTDPAGWQQSWGLVHPNLLDDEYYHHQFGGLSYLLSSDPYDLRAIHRWAIGNEAQHTLGLSGGELMCAARIDQ